MATLQCNRMATSCSTSTTSTSSTLTRPVLPVCSNRQQFTSLRRAGTSRPVARQAVVVRAALQPPPGVSSPPRNPQTPEARFGFVHWAEKINGRAAMLGFFGVLIVELIANRGVLEMMGFKIGNGLGFEL